MWRRALQNCLKIAFIGSSITFTSSFVFSQEQLYAWGWNNFGQLGIGNSISQYSPQLVPIQNVLFVACKSSVSAAIDKSGKLYTWGRSKFGLLGNGQVENINVPTLVECLKHLDFKYVACGNYHMAAITNDGQLYTWGNFDHGKLGHSFDNSVKLPSREKYEYQKNLGSAKLPELVQLNFKVRQVSLGDQFTIILSDEGNVYSVGLNKKGILGYETKNAEELNFKQITSLKNIVQIDSGTDFSVALDSDGNMFAWGSNYFGQLGTPSPSVVQIPQQIKGLPKIKQFSCGEQFIGALSTEGVLYTWGFGGDGQLGTPSKQDIPTPHKIQFDHNIDKVSCGQAHVGIISNNKLYMHGRGKEGQLGRGSETESPNSSRYSPLLVMENVIKIACGGSHSFAIVNQK
ncbi:unnamed protein product [Paramecium pentaurelia]|uniref:RCC1-like domain-containing protein n=1 Tax=Paramecium pentaurelia TaxID=43138 RepID=A0A8S1UT80_9CILI|nr:unnamed protein product [Paramecium pentaurelia]